MIDRLGPVTGKVVEKLKHYHRFMIVAATLTTVTLIIYGNDLRILLNEALQNEALSHILLLPFLVAFLLYQKKDTVRASLALERHRKTSTQWFDEVIGVALCSIAFIVYWYGSFTFYALEYRILSLPLFFMGVTLVLLNRKVLVALILPILFLLFLIPAPVEFVSVLGGAMGNFNTHASYFLLNAVGMPVELSDTYGPPTVTLMTTVTGQPSSFTIDLPCSGIYSLMAFAMFATFLAFITFGPIWKKILMFVSGFLIFETLNVLRIVTIVSVAYQFGEEIAMLIFHNIAGLVLIFIGMFIVLFITERFLKMQILSKAQESVPCRRCKTARRKLEDFCTSCGKLLAPVRTRFSHRLWTKLFLLLIGCSVIALSTSTPTFVFSEGVIEFSSASSGQNATSIFPQVSGYQNATFLYRDTNYEKMAHQDASVWYAYTNRSKLTVYVSVNVASSITNLHNWEVCLISWQTMQGQSPLVSVLDSRDVQLLQDVPIIARLLVFKGLPELYNYTQVTLYWYERATFNTGITLEPRFIRVNLVILTQDLTGLQRHEDELLMIGQSIVSHWEPVRSQSLISLGVPALQLSMVFSIAFVVTAEISQFSRETMKKMNNRKIFDKHASSRDKKILGAVLELVKERKVVKAKDVDEALRAKSGKTIAFTKLVDALDRFAEYGFIRATVTTIRNVPRLVWKA